MIGSSEMVITYLNGIIRCLIMKDVDTAVCVAWKGMHEHEELLSWDGSLET